MEAVKGHKPSILYLIIKRIFDIIVGLLGLVLLIPIIIFVKIAYIFSGDFYTIFYSHKRVGKNGKEFRLIKFRTMVPKADKVLDDLLKDPIYSEEYDKNKNFDNEIFYNRKAFELHMKKVLNGFSNEIISKVIDGLSVMDKKVEIQKDKKGNIIYDKESKDIEIVGFKTKIEDYMRKEVLPYIPDAKEFFEENLTAKKPVIKVGAEIPFTRYFYVYKEPESSGDLLNKFKELENELQPNIKKLF